MKVFGTENKITTLKVFPRFYGYENLSIQIREPYANTLIDYDVDYVFEGHYLLIKINGFRPDIDTFYSIIITDEKNVVWMGQAFRTDKDVQDYNISPDEN